MDKKKILALLGLAAGGFILFSSFTGKKTDENIDLPDYDPTTPGGAAPPPLFNPNGTPNPNWLNLDFNMSLLRPNDYNIMYIKESKGAGWNDPLKCVVGLFLGKRPADKIKVGAKMQLQYTKDSNYDGKNATVLAVYPKIKSEEHSNWQAEYFIQECLINIPFSGDKIGVAQIMQYEPTPIIDTELWVSNISYVYINTRFNPAPVIRIWMQGASVNDLLVGKTLKLIMNGLDNPINLAYNNKQGRILALHPVKVDSVYKFNRYVDVEIKYEGNSGTVSKAILL